MYLTFLKKIIFYITTTDVVEVGLDVGLVEFETFPLPLFGTNKLSGGLSP